MVISHYCEKCLMANVKSKTNNEEFIADAEKILQNRQPDDTAVVMTFLIDKLYQERFGSRRSFTEEKRTFNSFVLSLEDDIRKRIASADDPLLESFLIARIGNYIDCALVKHSTKEEFLELLDKATVSESDMATYSSFLKQCSTAKSFMLIADNCGEIILDKLFIERLKVRFSNITNVTVLVRGGEVLNDVTYEDAIFAGLDKVAKIKTNGEPLAGTVYKRLPDEIKRLIGNTDIILAKGQGNFESLGGQGRHVFYSFLCKCDYFVEYFGIPRFTGLFIEE